jgi:hypothetical protein
MQGGAVTNRFIRITVAVVALAGLAGQVRTAGQAPQNAASENGNHFTPPKTPWGDPDLSGHWLPGGGGRMETPAGKPWEGPRSTPADAAFSAFFAPEAGENPTRPREPERTMIVDPPDGRVPMQPWALAKRTEIMANQEKVENLDPRVRCLQSGIPRAHLPVGYNTYQILQIPGYVILLYEWNHMYRYIPLDGRPHISPNIRLPLGDSRGRWEGNTLVVDVTNLTNTTWAVGHGAPPDGAPASALSTGHGVFHTENLHVVERFTLTDAKTIEYQATIDDPKVFTRPWTIRFNAFNRAPADHELFEYACHEGNGRNVKLMTGFDIETGTSAPRK